MSEYTADQLKILRAMAVRRREEAIMVIPSNLMPKALMIATGMNQSELAKYLGVTQSMLSTIEAKGIKKPSTYIVALRRVGLWVD